MALALLHSTIAQQLWREEGWFSTVLGVGCDTFFAATIAVICLKYWGRSNHAIKENGVDTIGGFLEKKY